MHYKYITSSAIRSAGVLSCLIFGLAILIGPVDCFSQIASTDSPALGFYTDKEVYIFDGEIREWAIGPLDGPVLTHASSANGFAFATPTSLQFYDQQKRTWRKFPIEGQPVKVLHSGQTVALLTNKFAYVYEIESNHFSEVFLGSRPLDIVHNNLGSYAVCTEKYAYIYMGEQETWFSRKIQGNFAGIFTSSIESP